MMQKSNITKCKQFHAGIALVLFVFSMFLNSFKGTTHHSSANSTTLNSRKTIVLELKPCFVSTINLDQSNEIELEEELEEEEIKFAYSKTFLSLNSNSITNESDYTITSFDFLTTSRIPFYLLYKNSKAYLI
jgi:hypothetical protein